MYSAIITILIVVLIAIIYNWKIRDKIDEKNISWYDTLTSTSISIVMSFSVGIILFLNQGVVEDESKKVRFINLLNTEANSILYNLNTSGKSNLIRSTDTLVVTITYVQTLVIDEAIKSGLFSKEETTELNLLSYEVKKYNTLINYLMSVLSVGKSNPNFDVALKIAEDKINNVKKSIIKSSEYLIHNLKLMYPDQLST